MPDWTQEFLNAVDLLISDLDKEKSNELGKNYARLAKGRHLTSIERIANKAENEGVQVIADGYTPLQYAKELAEVHYAEQMVFDVNLSPSEISTTRGAYKAIEPLGGMDCRFDDVYAMNPDTGEPLVNDAGEPFSLPVSQVNVNALYQMRDLLTEYPDRKDEILSFTNRFGEKGVAAWYKRIKNTGAGEKLTFADMQGVANATTDEGKPFNGADLVRHMKQKDGDDDGGGYKNVTISAEAYDDLYRPVRQMASLILGSLGRKLESDGGLLGNTSLMTLLLDLVHPRHTGPFALLEAFAKAGDISEEEVKTFIALWEADGLADRWAEFVDGDVPTVADVYGPVADESMKLDPAAEIQLPASNKLNGPTMEYTVVDEVEPVTDEQAQEILDAKTPAEEVDVDDKGWDDAADIAAETQQDEPPEDDDDDIIDINDIDALFDAMTNEMFAVEEDKT